MVNVNKLKGKIVECGMGIPEFAEKIGMDKATLYRKLNSGGRKFTIEEANIISKELNLSFEEVNTIFFDYNVA